MVYDDHGGNQALDAVEALVQGGATAEIVTPERTLSPDVGSLTASGYFNSVAEDGVAVTVLRRLHGVRSSTTSCLMSRCWIRPASTGRSETRRRATGQSTRHSLPAASWPPWRARWITAQAAAASCTPMPTLP